MHFVDFSYHLKLDSYLYLVLGWDRHCCSHSSDSFVWPKHKT